MHVNAQAAGRRHVARRSLARAGGAGGGRAAAGRGAADDRRGSGRGRRGRGAQGRRGGRPRPAAYLHRRRAALRHHAHASYVRRASRRALWPGDASGASYPADASALDAFSERGSAAGAGRRIQNRSGQRDRRLLPGGDRAPRRACETALQQGPASAQDGHLRARAVPQRQIPIHGPRRPGHRAFNHIAKGKGNVRPRHRRALIRSLSSFDF